MRSGRFYVDSGMKKKTFHIFQMLYVYTAHPSNRNQLSVGVTSEIFVPPVLYENYNAKMLSIMYTAENQKFNCAHILDKLFINEIVVTPPIGIRISELILEVYIHTEIEGGVNDKKN